jgi:DNA-binding MarR family transcriptional regulator
MSETLNTRYLETLLGYNTRRATLVIVADFMEQMQPYDLSTVEFSVLSLIRHNPGITSRQICAALNILPPNLVGLLKRIEKRELITRAPHLTDGRAIGLSLTAAGDTLTQAAEKTAASSDAHCLSNLSTSEQEVLKKLLKKIYRQPAT